MLFPGLDLLLVTQILHLGQLGLEGVVRREEKV